MAAQLSRRRFVCGSTATLSLSTLPMAASRADEKPAERWQPRFAICNETFRGWAMEKAFAFAAECGYQGIEIAPFTLATYVTDISPARRRELRRLAEQAGLQVVGLHWLLARTKGLHLTSPDAEVRRRTARYLGELARFCADLGGRLLVFGSPQQRNLLPGVSRAAAMRHAAEVIRQALPVLEKTDVRLALEPLSPRTTSFLRTAAEAVELIQLIDSPRCRLILDCNAMAHQPEGHAACIRRYARYLIHFHANDPNRQGPGFGQLDFVPILQALRDVNYHGWISVEVFDYSPGPQRLARQSIQYLRRCAAAVGG